MYLYIFLCLIHGFVFIVIYIYTFWYFWYFLYFLVYEYIRPEFDQIKWNDQIMCFKYFFSTWNSEVKLNISLVFCYKMGSKRQKFMILCFYWNAQFL